MSKPVPLMKSLLLICTLLMVIPLVFSQSPICTFQSPMMALDLTDSLTSDCSGNGRDFTNNGVTQTTAGGVFVASELDYLNSSGDPYEFGTGEFTICFRAGSFGATTGTHIISHWQPSGDDGIRIVNSVSAGDHSTFFYIGSDPSQNSNSVDRTANHTYCYRRNASATGNKNSFIDDVSGGDQTDTDTASALVETPFEIGRRSVITGAYIDATIEWVAIWNFSVDREDLSTIMNGTLFEAQPISIDWDSDTPTNETYVNTNITFNYQVLNSNGSASCNIYDNRTGSFSINQSDTVGDGANNFIYEVYESQLETIQFFIECNSGTDQSNTSIKTIHIDDVNVIIVSTTPLFDNSSIYNQDVGAINLNISYSNTNLVNATYDLFKPNGALFQSNTTNSFPDPLNFVYIDGVTFPTDTTLYGEWIITAFGNDSANNPLQIDISFLILNNNISVVWSGSSPTNASTINNETSFDFNYTLTLLNLTSASCDFIENGIIIDTAVVSDGANSFTATYTTTTQDTRTYNINCTSSGFFDNGITKTIIIDNEEPFIAQFRFLNIIPLIFIITAFILMINLIRTTIFKK